MAARADETTEVSLAHVRLAGEMSEAPLPEEPLFSAGRENFKTRLDRLKKAAKDPKIQGLLLQLDGVQVGRGKLHELRQAIAEFKKSGKKAYAYVEGGMPGDYLVACACDEIVVPEQGWLFLDGMRAEISFYKNLLDKIGVQADMLQMGNFKGAAEPMTRDKMSDDYRAQLTRVLEDMYEHDYVGVIAASRKGLDAAKVKKLIDQGPFSAKEARAAGLVDHVAYFDDLKDKLKKPLKAESVKVVKDYARSKVKDVDLSNPFAFFTLFASPKLATSRDPKIAVIYATGVIVTGKGGEGLMGGESCGSTTMIEAIRQAEKDKTVKAIVLRVDSPGGSALASDLIWNELVKCEKPVVASMGDVAASGGYYISMGAKKIFAEPGTLTGSIGVVGGKLVTDKLFREHLGINTEVIAFGQNSGIFSDITPFSKTEREAFTRLMQETYDQFLAKAIQGREKAGKKFTRDEFVKFAEGRVWSGRQAKEHGLIDELGTLQDAINHAKQLAKMPDDDVELLMLPKPRSFVDQLLDAGADARLSSLTIRRELARKFPEASRHANQLDGFLQLRGEPVWAILPYQIVIR
jgi:protease-4